MKNGIVLLTGKNITAKANAIENNTFPTVVFTRLKKDGFRQMFLKIKRLNKFVNYKHFKME